MSVTCPDSSANLSGIPQICNCLGSVHQGMNSITLPHTYRHRSLCLHVLYRSNREATKAVLPVFWVLRQYLLCSTQVSTLGNSPVSASQVLRSQVGTVTLSSQPYSSLTSHLKMCLNSSADPTPSQRLLPALPRLCAPRLTPRQAGAFLYCIVLSSENFFSFFFPFF